MTSKEIDQYLATLDETKRATLEKVRTSILHFVPGAEQGMSYGVPAFRVDGKVVAGFAAFKNHLSYLPHSGSVFPELESDLAGYVMSKGALHFALDRPLPRPLVGKLLKVKMHQAFPDGRPDTSGPRRRRTS